MLSASSKQNTPLSRTGNSSAARSLRQAKASLADASLLLEEASLRTRDSAMARRLINLSRHAAGAAEPLNVIIHHLRHGGDRP